MAFRIYVMWIYIHITDQRESSDLLTNPEKMDFYHVFISSLDLTHWRALVTGGGTPTLKMLVSTLAAPDTSEPAVTWFISDPPQHALRAAGVPQDWESSTLYLRLIPLLMRHSRWVSAGQRSHSYYTVRILIHPGHAYCVDPVEAPPRCFFASHPEASSLLPDCQGVVALLFLLESENYAVTHESLGSSGGHCSCDVSRQVWRGVEASGDRTCLNFTFMAFRMCSTSVIRCSNACSILTLLPSVSLHNMFVTCIGLLYLSIKENKTNNKLDWQKKSNFLH